jgi:hypothetical protein
VTTSGRQVILSGSAQASHIFWQVGSSATLGTTSSFKGTIMALASISLLTGATLDGRALAQTGAVSLDGNTVTSSGAVTSVEIASTPSVISLSQNFPNPFNPSTKITYSLQKAGTVSLKIYNLLGREVATLVNARQEAGTYAVPFNVSQGTPGIASGVYFYRLQTGSFVSVKRLVLIQ